MTRALIVRRAGPSLTVQDAGRPGYLTYGVSRGGAMDPTALREGAALLGQDPGLAALEMAGMGGVFEATEPLRISLTGAPMKATLDSQPLRWNASHNLGAGAQLSIGGVEAGQFGYLSVGGGIQVPEVMGSKSSHLAAGIGKPLTDQAVLPVGPDTRDAIAQTVQPEPRFSGGTVRVVPSLQTGLFDPTEIDRFQETEFRRDPRSNRMGVRLTFEGAGFATDAGLSILSEVIVPGDIQITGDGTPFVLMNECQTVGGYPRIGSVLPSDLPIVAQASSQNPLRFEFISLVDAVAVEKRATAAHRDIATRIQPLVRDPSTIRDLLSYQLVSGVTAGE